MIDFFIGFACGMAIIAVPSVSVSMYMWKHPRKLAHMILRNGK